MNRRSRQRGQVLILLGMWLFFGGGGASALVVYDRPASDVEKAVKRVITDTGRRDSILSTIEKWEWSQEKRDESIGKSRNALLKTLRRNDSRSDMESIIEKLDGSILEMDLAYLDLRFRLKDQVTSAEWAQIVKPPSP